MHKETIYWLLKSTAGLVITGAGLCLAIDAGWQKAKGEPWLLYGTMALGIFNSGICITIDAGLQRLKSNLVQKMQNEQRESAG